MEREYQQSLVVWLSGRGLFVDFDGVYYTVEDSTLTVLALWNPVPELEIDLE